MATVIIVATRFIKVCDSQLGFATGERERVRRNILYTYIAAVVENQRSRILIVKIRGLRE